ncbi:hypothetical protein BABINDRAFT_162064 [Babjeviella inositovora NRRL Y-12698]|uniref:RRM domain-containing protein n=1 Tax=Babjeviella inositovora NRRL Y-12698 TaxID=984486 RepID=A0A1E3QPJ0_9ASCO|nr:uncharacterized protein BABINDRAFT_162064 [Babjeviella inositovora NRRL Y-12698]ODQ78982.1 hypothetical protein BABINDRAFT_162064 [Babjeviella inositovora NRRL Y-12698]
MAPTKKTSMPAATKKSVTKTKKVVKTVPEQVEAEDLLLPESSDEDIDGFASTDDEQEEQESTPEPKEVAPKKAVSAHTVKKSVVKDSKDAGEKKPRNRRGVVYVGRLPHGFHEEELKKYFAQFGDITRLRLSRNKKTGESKHYAFVEFSELEVAKIAAETMNNYLLFGHLLKVAVLEKEKVHDELFNGANTKFKVIPWSKIAKNKNDSPKPIEKWNKIVKSEAAKKTNKQKKLATSGINFDLALLE